MSTPLETLGRPYFFAVEDSDHGDVPSPRLDQAHRTRVRSLSGMQKEALVTSSVSGTTWRLVSDEGDYLDGDDVAPPPLAFMTTGVVSSVTTELLALADQRGVEVDDVEVRVDNYYTMNGSALRGTMTGGALPIDVDVVLDADTDEETVQELVETAITLSPVSGLLQGTHESVFTLTCNGKPVAPDRVDELDSALLSDPNAAFETLAREATRRDPPLMNRTDRTAEPPATADQKYTSSEGSSLEEEQDRILHLQGVCTLDDDGVKRIETRAFSPVGTVFEFRSDEPEGHGGHGRAPDAMTYVAAGLGLCFMTQLGRYADIVDTELTDYRIVQDTHASRGGASAGTNESGRIAPVETHVFLDTPAGEEFAREALDMGEQTCFLHALSRTDLDEPAVTVSKSH
ncbi:OsmC family protein [Halobium palmae]|uniref:OsmC family protein n=1 Tax=Halobium palmae TaxID=1776492 RepID=A0ABD5RVH4_9EURY